ncbi:MAG: Trk system potassium transport protein TrkA, partial [Alphaproteobacteria bacterium]|nr:Trk system potassium transport protein TrkA [Alphaproteobacteria bacterium]
GVMIGAIVRDGKMICPRSSTVIEPKDRIVLFAAAESVRKVEQMFSVQLEYF